MQKLKFSILISVLFLTFTSNYFAQTDSTKIDLEGKWALQFGISENFTLSSFQGGTISAKYHFTNNSALRFGVTLYHSNLDREYTETSVYPDTTFNSIYEDNYARYQIQFTLQYISYIETINSISMFYGGGINYFTSPDNRESSSERKVPIESSSLDYSNYGFGVNLLIGVEWFVRSNMGITAEYGSGYQYSLYEQVQVQDDIINDVRQNTRKTQTRYGLSSSTVKFGVSIYF